MLSYRRNILLLHIEDKLCDNDLFSLNSRCTKQLELVPKHVFEGFQLIHQKFGFFFLSLQDNCLTKYLQFN